MASCRFPLNKPVQTYDCLLTIYIYVIIDRALAPQVRFDTVI